MALDHFIEQIDVALSDDAHKRAFRGAIRCIRDEENPVRLNMFSMVLRELLGSIFLSHAPNKEVVDTHWYPTTVGVDGKKDGQVFWIDRIRFALIGNLSDKLITELKLDKTELEDDISALYEQHRQCSEFVHFGDKAQRDAGLFVFEEDAAKIIASAEVILGSFYNFLQSFNACRYSISDAIRNVVSNEVFDLFMATQVSELDIMSSRTLIQSVGHEDAHIMKIGVNEVLYHVSGDVEVELNWGRRDDAAQLDESFPFVATYKAPIDDISKLELVEYDVDTSSWYGE